MQARPKQDVKSAWTRMRTSPELPIDEVDTDAIEAVEPYLGAMARYFRYEARHFERLPVENALIVANHSGGKLPIDMFLFGHAWYKYFGYEGRRIFPLMHDILFATKFLRQSFRRLGCVPAHPKNARTLLGMGKTVLVLPGGDYETFRPFSERYKIDFGRRAGFCDLALRTKVPIVPVVTIGSHEIFFILRRGQRFAKWFGLTKVFRYNAFPITLGLPFGLYLGPLPSPLPLPAKMTAEMLDPIYLHREEADHRAYKEKDLEDEQIRFEMQRVVVARMQAAMTRLAAERRFPVIG